MRTLPPDVGFVTNLLPEFGLENTWVNPSAHSGATPVVYSAVAMPAPDGRMAVALNWRTAAGEQQIILSTQN